MSAVPDKAGNSPPSVWRPNIDWLLRPLFGFILAGVALGSLWLGDPVVIFIAAVTVAGAREWHRMVDGAGYTLFWVTTSVGLAGALVSVMTAGSPAEAFVPWFILAAGAGVNALLGLLFRRAALWHAAGILYIGIPAVLLFQLRMQQSHGFWVVFGLLIAIWATDTGALLSGTVLRGPKLWPAISPNKTWAGFIGGIICAAVTEGIYIAFLGGQWGRAAIFGASLGLVAHAGDMFESWIKRRFKRKDSGHMIPGHGGVLDRIDSTLMAMPFAAFVIFVLLVDTLFGAQP